MEDSQENVADSNRGDDAPVAPSVDEMISASVASGNGMHGNDTSLDELHYTLIGEVEQRASTVASAETPRRRGRPRKDDTSPAPVRSPAKTKAELQADLDKATSELAAERARNDANKVTELAKSIELACYLGFGVVAEARGPHWGVTQKEAEDIGKSGAVAMAPYAAQLTTQLPWIVFAGTVGKVIYSRIQQDRALIAQYGTTVAPKDVR